MMDSDDSITNTQVNNIPLLINSRHIRAPPHSSLPLDLILFAIKRQADAAPVSFVSKKGTCTNERDLLLTNVMFCEHLCCL